MIYLVLCLALFSIILGFRLYRIFRQIKDIEEELNFLDRHQSRLRVSAELRN